MYGLNRRRRFGFGMMFFESLVLISFIEIFLGDSFFFCDI